MGRVHTTDRCNARHRALLLEAAALLDAVPTAPPILLCDAGESATAPRGGIRIELRDGPAVRLSRLAPAYVQLAYPLQRPDCAVAALVGAAATMSGGPVAAAPAMLATLALAARVGASDIPVLIEGPTGTGKEVLARFVHAGSDRRDGPFVALNCAAMPEAMLEAMLFGHRKGAFTGAGEAAPGFFRAADKGTLLLDEIGEMPIGLQAKLLRALQEGEVVPLGETAPVPVDVRIVACTNRDLPAAVAGGQFREDLYYRLNVFPLRLLPLRERPEDIASLAHAMLLRHGADEGPICTITPEACALLETHGWPGNVRELENVLRRAMLLAGPDAAAIGAEHIRFDGAVRGVPEPPATAASISSMDDATNLGAIGRASQERAIIDTLRQCSGNRRRTARALGISERTLRYRLADMRDAGVAVATAGAAS